MSSYSYYYTSNPSLKYYKNSEKIAKANRKLAEPYKLEIEKAYGKSLIIQPWNKGRFGCVYTDFPEKKYKKNGKGEKILFDRIKENFFAIVFSDDEEIDYSKIITIDKGEIFVLNLPKFRNALTIGQTKEIVKIFVDRSEKSEEYFDSLLEEYRKSDKIHEKLTFDDFKKFLQSKSSAELAELQQLVPEFRKIEKDYKVSPDNLTAIVDGITQFSKSNRIDPVNFAKMVDVMMTNISEKYELKPESFSKLVDMMGIFSKEYNVKTVPELEKLLGFVIDFFEKHRIDKPTDFKKIMNMVLKLTPKYEITDPSDLKKILELCRMSDDLIKSNPTYFKRILDDFKKLIDDEKTLEKDVHKLIADNPWILDFKYWGYPIKESPKKITKDDLLDLYLEKPTFKTRNISLIEFKKPEKPLTFDDYRKNKPVISAEVGRALSQLIHYKEKLGAKEYHIVEGVVVIGKKTKETDYFIDVFSSYLHGIDITTFDDLYDKAMNVVNAFDSVQ